MLGCQLRETLWKVVDMCVAWTTQATSRSTHYSNQCGETILLSGGLIHFSLTCISRKPSIWRSSLCVLFLVHAVGSGSRMGLGNKQSRCVRDNLNERYFSYPSMSLPSVIIGWSRQPASITWTSNQTRPSEPYTTAVLFLDHTGREYFLLAVYCIDGNSEWLIII